MTILRRGQKSIEVARRSAIMAVVTALSSSTPGTFSGPAAPSEIVETAATGGAVTAVAWDGDVSYAAVGRQIVALRRAAGGPAVEVARLGPLPGVVDSMSAASGRVALRLADDAGGDIAVLVVAGDRLLRHSTISGLDAGAPFHGLNLTGDGLRLLTVSDGDLRLWNVNRPLGMSLSSLSDVRGRPGSSGVVGAVGSAAGGLTTFSLSGDVLERQGTVAGPDVDEVTLPTASRAMGIARGEPPTGQVLSYDITDPATAIESARLPLAAGASFAALGTRAVSGQTSTGLVQMYEAPGPIPIPRGVVTAHVPLAVAMAGESGMVGAAEGLYFVDAPDPAAPTLHPGPELGAGIANAVAWSGEVAYVAHGGGLAVFSTESGTLTPVGSVERPGRFGGLLLDLEHGGRSVAAGEGGAVYVASGEGGVVTYDAAVPADPTVADQEAADSLGGAVRAVALDRWLYAATESGVSWLDVARPLNPSLLGSEEVPSGATAVSASAGWVMAISSERLLVSPTDDTGPEGFVAHPEIERAQAVAADGTTAVALSGSKLYVLNLLSGAALPPVARVVELPDPGLALAYGARQGAWVALADRIVRVDVGPPGRLIGEVETANGSVRALAMASDDALAAMGSIGLVRVHSTERISGPTRVLYLPRTITSAHTSLR